MSKAKPTTFDEKMLFVSFVHTIYSIYSTHTNLSKKRKKRSVAVGIKFTESRPLSLTLEMHLLFVLPIVLKRHFPIMEQTQWRCRVYSRAVKNDIMKTGERKK